MPLATLHLVALTPQTSLHQFLALLQSTTTTTTTTPAAVRPITVAKVIRWIITPSVIDTDPLLHPPQPWTLLLILPGTDTPLPATLHPTVAAQYTLSVGIPSRLLTSYATTNAALLHPPSSSIPPLTGALTANPIIHPTSSQTLTLSPSLHRWIRDDFAHTAAGQGAVSVLNLLAFIPEKRASYVRYGKAFAESIGSRRGGDAKLVGHVVYPPDASVGKGPGKGGQGDVLQTPVVALDGDGRSAGHQDSTNATATTDTTTTKPNEQEETLQVPAVSLDDTSSSPSSASPRWDEFALAHYPSIAHFGDMLASADYQEVNQRDRVPALRDTCILCTSEITVEEVLRVSGEKAPGPKL